MSCLEGMKLELKLSVTMYRCRICGAQAFVGCLQQDQGSSILVGTGSATWMLGLRVWWSCGGLFGDASMRH
jgi:hypothetical protein